MKKNMEILIAEDDKSLGTILKSYLATHGYSCTLCIDGQEALSCYKKDDFDLIISDIILPGMDGFAMVKEIRSKDKDIPIIFLTAKSLQSDIIRGLELGADDYITKPFNMNELLLRIESIFKRIGIQAKSHHTFKIGTYVFDTIRRRLVRFGKEYKLTSKELDLLQLFCENIGKVVERPYALKVVWKEDNYFSARNMDVYVGRLRNILCDDPNIVLENVHGVGYKLVVH